MTGVEAEPWDPKKSQERPEVYSFGTSRGLQTLSLHNRDSVIAGQAEAVAQKKGLMQAGLSLSAQTTLLFPSLPDW